MKLLSVSALSAVAMANDFAAMWEGAIAKSQGAIDAIMPALRSAGDDRNAMDLFTLSNVFNYGCWCYFGNQAPARGPVMDEVDGFCQTWYHSKDCIGIDNGPTCDISMQYNDVLTAQQNPFDPSLDYMGLCQTANAGDQCAIENCAVDAYFLRSIFNHMAFNHLNSTLSQAFGWDKDICRGLSGSDLAASTVAPFTTAAPVVVTTAAPGTTEPPVPADACCGSYPNRFPYKTKQGTRSCCNDNTYNNLLLECCPNNSIAVIGMC